MATIQDYLNQIKNAIYGKDVRQAIHDGIQQCYYDGKAGSTDLEARQRLDSAEGSISSLGSRMSTAENDIDVLDSRVDQIVAPSGEAPSAAEVSDARVDVDGMIYTNLGDAVRGQVADLKENVSIIDNETVEVYKWALFDTNGYVDARSQHRSVILPCEPNTTYHIKNPKGNILVVGSSSVMPHTDWTFSHYSVLTSKLPNASYTTGSGEVYMMIDYWYAYQTYTDEQAIADLSVFKVIAEDPKARIALEVAKPTGGIYVAASDSADKYKLNADYICTGSNDQVTLQNAIDALGTDGTLHLAVGTYIIDAFFTADDGANDYALRIGVYDGAHKRTRVKIMCDNQMPTRVMGNGIANCAVLKISDACYNSLSSNDRYSVIRTMAENGSSLTLGYNILDIEGIGIKLPDNQKKIVCIDGKYASSMLIKRCMLNAKYLPGLTPADMKVANNECIGIRCCNSSNFGIGNRIDTCACYGFGQAFAVSGEHFIIADCKSRWNNYGFTFNNDGDAISTHPNTLINCTSEFDFNFPKFVGHTFLQPITMIDFNMEYQSDFFALGGHYAEEATPGQCYGTINYTIKGYGDEFERSGNTVSVPFWATGHGRNVKTHNDAQKFMAYESEYTTYAPNQMQRIYDRSHDRFLTYVDGAWVEA